jgi:epoxyqueuosine reductase QueG
MNSPSSWLTEWMAAAGIKLWGFADLQSFSTPVDEDGSGFPRAISFAIPMSPTIMAGIQQGPVPSYANEFTQVNETINTIGAQLELELRTRGHRAMSMAASSRIDPERLIGEFPHKTAATRAGLGWIGKSCQLVTRSHGPWVRLGTVLTDLEGACGPSMERSYCGTCTRCVEACPAKALKGALWQPGMPREEILDAHACDRWKKEHFADFLEGRLCGICSSVCPFGTKILKAQDRT